MAVRLAQRPWAPPAGRSRSAQQTPPTTLPAMGRVRVGISGWTYAGWRGDFYPSGLPHRRELAYAAERMTSIEINGSFYSLQRPTSYTSWREQTPDDFVFAVKGGRFITHMKKLRDVGTPLANFFASGVLALGPKLGPVLWQLPENLPYDAERLGGIFPPPPPPPPPGAGPPPRAAPPPRGPSWPSATTRRCPMTGP